MQEAYQWRRLHRQPQSRWLVWLHLGAASTGAAHTAALLEEPRDGRNGGTIATDHVICFNGVVTTSDGLQLGRETSFVPGFVGSRNLGLGFKQFV